MFLKTESLEYSGVTVTLSELSVLQRTERLTWSKGQEKKAESSGNLQVSVEDLIRGGAFLVAVSLWHNHPQKTKLPSISEAIEQIEQEVFIIWSTEAITQAENTVLRLSGMSEFAVNSVPGQADDAGPVEPASAGKCSMVS